jgi:hypothetical protein
MILTQEHLGLLTQLASKELVVRGFAPQVCEDLEDAGYVRIVPAGWSEHRIEITPEGRERLSR